MVTDADIDSRRVGELFLNLATSLTAFGWESPVAALDYMAATDAETQFLLDFLSICKIGGDPDARARLARFADDNEALDRIAAAIV